MLKAIIFDFDGVIVDTEPLHYRAFASTVAPLGIGFDYERYRQQYIGFDDRDGFRAICSEHNVALDDDGLGRLIVEKAATFAGIVGEGIAPLPGAIELIEAAAAVMPIAICSGALRQDIDLILPLLGGGGVHERFRGIVCADDVERSKPDPQCYTLAAQRLGIAPQHCVAIEDTPAGIISARDAGLRTLAVASSFPIDRLLDAERVVGSLAEVNLELLSQWFAAEPKKAAPDRRGFW